MDDNRPLQKSSAQDLLQDLAFPIQSKFVHKTSACSLSKPLAQCPCFLICNPPLVLLESTEKLLRILRSYIFKSMHMVYLFSFAI